MNTLTRTDFRPDGIMGEFTFDGDPGRFCVTLEHSYDNQPKLQPGTYSCVRGVHTLHNGIPFTTFEITGVAGHTGILFHAGNFNRDSEGCVLIGRDVSTDPNTGEEMVTGSKLEFAQFMERLDGIDTFQLTVV